MESRNNYIKPEISCIQLDNDITLHLQSAQPSAPGGSGGTDSQDTGYAPEYFNNNDPFKLG